MTPSLSDADEEGVEPDPDGDTESEWEYG